MQISTLLAQIGVLEKQLINEKSKHGHTEMMRAKLEEEMVLRNQEISGLVELRKELSAERDRRDTFINQLKEKEESQTQENRTQKLKIKKLETKLELSTKEFKTLRDDHELELKKHN